MGAHNDVADIFAGLRQLVRERRPEDRLLRSFLPRFYRELPDEDVDDRRIEEAYGAAVAQLELGQQRQPGESKVEVRSPTVGEDGWHTDHSMLMFITEDVPFLIDTIRLVLERNEIGIRLLVHPMLGVDRDDDGMIRAFGKGRDHVEAWIMFEIDRCSPAVAARLEAEVHDAIQGVHDVVDDFATMRGRLRDVRGDSALLEWLGEQHFVFLGAATYRRTAGGLVPEAGSELGEYRSGRLDPAVIDPPAVDGDAPYAIARTDSVSRIHRPARMTTLSVRPDGTDLEHRFVGLLGSGAYRQSVFAIPEVEERGAEVLARIGASLDTYTGRAVRNVIENLPRDIVFEHAVDSLVELVADIVGLQERQIVRLFDVAEPVGPWTTVLVYVPRSRFTADLPDEIATLVSEHYGGRTRDLEVLLGASSLARISMTVRAPRLAVHDELIESIDAASTTWHEQVGRALVDELGELEGQRVFGVVGQTVPPDYEARVPPTAAVADLAQVAMMLDPVESRNDDVAEVATSFGCVHREAGADGLGLWRFRVFLKDRPALIAELVPILEHLGLVPVDEHPSEFVGPDGTVFLYDVGVDIGEHEMSDEQHLEIQRAFVGLMSRDIEGDRLNRLTLVGGLSRRQIAVLRLYDRYLRQVGFPFSPSYIERTIVRHADIACALSELFDIRFDPRLALDADEREERASAVREHIHELLDEVPSLDDDRICRAFLTLIDATSRTNAFRGRQEVAVKLQPHDISFLPEPRPQFEVFVCSSRVEGVHLRGGLISRGGLRWSDRPEDFRTEVLGLVKAQMVKNAVIVPMGAKGGFVVKASTADPVDRDAFRAEGVDRYQRFIRGLLDLTDNVSRGEVQHPLDTIIYDRDDPYLVVAADKGTASFSDIANQLALEADFWLGDAFASGGSHGYDHKEMGITARGAWESVRRHARVIGKDVAHDELTTVGIGDMSGDVFGNGMLQSPHLRLVAAFDHRHVFLDPDPDPTISYGERRRLFDLPRSSWADYDTSLISEGGGVHSRAKKSIPITPQVRQALGLSGDVDELSPAKLISAILSAPVDLLWNGGIGTYVKASSESHADVGDRANDSVRVDGADLRTRIVGEGGNLGFTQLARIEYAIDGGLIYTDAIDNSAGVDCSDHEVNIKILLDDLVRDEHLTQDQRNELLVEMTDDVAEHVLDDNRAQTLALMIARTQSLAMVNVHARYLDSLEADGYLDRQLEFLPSDKQIAERQSAGSGLRVPEFAVMIAYTKNADFEEILDSDLPDDPTLEAELMGYFPQLLGERFPDAIRGHRLRREIIATRIVNNMVNLAGISFDHRMTEDSGASVSDVARAFIASREIFGFADIWAEIDDLGSSIALDEQIALFLDARRMAERGTVWLLRHRHPPLAIADAVETFSAGMTFLGESLDEVVSDHVKQEIEAVSEARVEAGVPAGLAARSARFRWLHTAFDVVEIAHSESTNVADAATAYWSVFDAFELGWMWDAIAKLPRSDRWQAQARSALRDDLMMTMADLTRLVMRSADGSPSAWISANSRSVGRALSMHTEIRRAESFDLTTLSVALRQLRNLTLTAVAVPVPSPHDAD